MTPPLIERLNPAAILIAAVLYTTPLLTTIDPVSGAVALVIAVPTLLAAGVRPRRFLVSCWPIYLAVPVSALSMLLYGRPGGRLYFEFLLARVTDNSISLAIGISLRVLAVGVPVVVAFASLEPTRLADALAQVLRLPARFVIGALAGMRLFAVFGDDWAAMAQARRARGLGDHGRLRRFFTMSFALLVLAIRRGSALSTAMEARGFGAGPRTWARPSRLHRRDWVAMGVALAIAGVEVGVAATLGAYRLIGSGT